MTAFLPFPHQLKWDSQTLAEAVPVRVRLHQLFAFDAKRDGAPPASANGDVATRPCWRHRHYLRVAELTERFQIR
jgi:hypothetical protein